MEFGGYKAGSGSVIAFALLVLFNLNLLAAAPQTTSTQPGMDLPAAKPLGQAAIPAGSVNNGPAREWV
jgi:hypothetical protein